MVDEIQNEEEYFYGVLILKDEKWTPHSKFDAKGLGGALMKAEELDHVDAGHDGVKIMKIPAKRSLGAHPEEVWISPSFKAKSEARAAADLRSGVKQTKQNMQEAHAQRKADIRKSS